MNISTAQVSSLAAAVNLGLSALLRPPVQTAAEWMDAMPAAWRWLGGACSKASVRSRSARRYCSLGRMSSGSLRHGQRRCGPRHPAE